MGKSKAAKSSSTANTSNSTNNKINKSSSRTNKHVASANVHAKVPLPVSEKSSKQHKPKFRTLLPGYIWVVENFLTVHECQEWIKFMEASSPKLLQQRGTYVMAARQCYRYHLMSDEVAASIFTRMQSTCAEATQLLPQATCIGCNPDIRFYKYTKGMSFGKHVDESNRLSPKTETRMTVLIYLSECKGGATSFEKPDGSGEVAYEPKIGHMLIHLHGDDCLLHAADPVIAGEKYILRTDLVYPCQSK